MGNNSGDKPSKDVKRKVIEIFLNDNKPFGTIGLEDLPEDIEIVLWDGKSPQDKSRKTCHRITLKKGIH